MLNPLLQLAIESCVNAGLEVSRIYKHDFEVNFKADDSPVTEADMAAHEVISEGLSPSKIKVISEEGANIPYAVRKHWKHYWLVDPIDGTRGFVKRNGQFTVNISLIQESKPVIGVIYVPEEDLLCYASKEGGAYTLSNASRFAADPSVLKESRKLQRESIGAHETLKVVVSRASLEKRTMSLIADWDKKYENVELIKIGSSLKFCRLAMGDADAYPRYAPCMEWDIAAGHILCEEAGYEVKGLLHGEPIKYNKPNLFNPPFVVC